MFFTYSNNYHIQAIPRVLKIGKKPQSESLEEEFHTKNYREHDVEII